MLLLLLACAEDPDRDGYADEDCAPSDPTVFPGAHEFCNARDDDCDGSIDETFDLDGDGYLADEADCRAMGVEVDCDDGDAAILPGAPEDCDGVDNDCSGLVDDAEDRDGDGFSVCDDCDDDDAFVSPDALEACDGIDNDCSGLADEAWDDDGDGVSPCGGDCDDDDASRSPEALEVCDGADNDCDDEADEGFDADGDGWLTCRGDCDDTEPSAYPGAEELCDGIDNDCDEGTIEDQDLDGDGWTSCDGDCDDTSAAALPGGTEECDGVDNDCDGSTDALPACWGCSESPPYLLCTSAVSWSDASDACALFDRSLVSIDSAEENATVGSLMSGYSPWIGLNDLDAEGSWVWEDGSSPAYTSWNPGEPNDSGGEDCATTNWGAVGGWNDLGCGSAEPFVCE